MCKIVKQLLAEKLIDDFYDEYEPVAKPVKPEIYLERCRMCCLSTNMNYWSADSLLSGFSLQ